MILRPDFSVVLTDSEGHVSLISSNTRQALIDDGSRTRIGKDTDYLVELERSYNEFTKGVYYAHVSSKDMQSKIHIKNIENDNKFILKSGNTLHKEIAAVEGKN